ncbi:TPA: protein kinase [Yersinia enterocolitica]|nr:protein kinase [Yersinia enterocolitica]HDL7801279.1 protein kinase [Yersinia enterocolitica]
MEEHHANYVIKPCGKIGSGGFGYVEKIELFNSAGHKCGDYARKIFSPQSDLYRDEFKRRFEREVLYQTRCRHRNIAPIYIHNLNCDSPWFILDLAESDLSKDLATGILNVKDKINIISMILAGVRFMHEPKPYLQKYDILYLHRDLKPSNVLKFSDGIYRISDFGLVKNIAKDQAGKDAESELLTKVAAAMGTEKYMAPEINAAGLYSVQSDIFALGVLMDEFDLKDIPEIKEIVDKCTAWRPANRYKSLVEIISELNNLKKRNGL